MIIILKKLLSIIYNMYKYIYTIVYTTVILSIAAIIYINDVVMCISLVVYLVIR